MIISFGLAIEMIVLLISRTAWVISLCCSVTKFEFLHSIAYVNLCAGVYESHCGSVRDVEAIAPVISPSVNPQPFLPLLAPSPLTPFTNGSVPTLSGIRYMPLLWYIVIAVSQILVCDYSKKFSKKIKQSWRSQ